MTRIGFPVELGESVARLPKDFEPVGRLAIKGAPKETTLTRTSHVCPYCSGVLWRVPDWMVKGRTVGIQDGVIAVDPIPEGLVALHCQICAEVFWTQQERI